MVLGNMLKDIHTAEDVHYFKGIDEIVGDYDDVGASGEQQSFEIFGRISRANYADNLLHLLEKDLNNAVMVTNRLELMNFHRPIVGPGRSLCDVEICRAASSPPALQRATVGFAAAKQLAGRGAHVIISSRDVARAEAAAEALGAPALSVRWISPICRVSKRQWRPSRVTPGTSTCWSTMRRFFSIITRACCRSTPMSFVRHWRPTSSAPCGSPKRSCRCSGGRSHHGSSLISSKRLASRPRISAWEPT